MLSKKAVIVGDILQIEPVWNVSPVIDYDNIIKSGITEFMKPDDLMDNGLSSSSGIVMKAALNSCNYMNEKGRLGVMLKEHRRCVPEIIKYCNELAYEGELKAMRENELKKYPLPHMGVVNVRGTLRTLPMLFH